MSATPSEPTALESHPLLLPTVGIIPAATTFTNTRVVLTTGAWDADIFDCCDSWVNCCTVWWLPCISLAQISQRIGWAPYWKVLQLLLVVYAIEILITAVVSFWIDAEVEKTAEKQRDTWIPPDEHTPWRVATTVGPRMYDASTFGGSFTELVMVAITWSLRGRVRQRLQIPGSLLNDGLVSLCCSLCAVAQMATQVQSSQEGTFDIGPVDTLPGFRDELPHYDYYQATPATTVRNAN